MGIRAKYTATITKTCDGCGESWEATQSFSSVAQVLAFGGPVEAARWEFQMTMTPGGMQLREMQLLCDRCAKHLRRE